MIDTPKTLDVPAQKIARIRLAVPSNEIMTHMTAGLAEVRQVLAAQGVKPIGAWFTHHFKVPDQTFDFEICLPVNEDIKPQGRVTPGELPAAHIARTVYHGNYDGLPHGWGEFLNWLKSENLTMAGDFWEVYSVGPDDTANPAHWRTQLNCPLV